MKKFYPSRFILVTLLFVAGAFIAEAIAQAPKITSFTPASGSVGTTVTITGSAFNTTAASNIVFFGATKATVSAATATSLTVTVPVGATYQPITVLNGATALQASSAKPFITTFSPNQFIVTAQDISPKVDFSTGNKPSSIAIGDLDGDGKSDLAVVSYDFNSIDIFRNTSANGSISAGSFAAPVNIAVGTSPFGVAIGDLDGDGKLDLAVANFAANTVSVLLNTSTIGSISATKTDVATASGPFNVAIGDLDGDGKPELVVTNRNSATVSVLRNTSTIGSSSFASKVDLPTGNNPFSVAIGDLDGDGKPDLAIANQNSNTVSVLRNISTVGSIVTGSFSGKVDFSTGSSPYSVAIADLDGDGKSDLAVANYMGNTVSVLLNKSTSGSIVAGSFATRVDFPTGSRPAGIVIGDMNGDGQLDMITANQSGNSVSILINNSSSGSIGAGSFFGKVDFAIGNTPYGVAMGDLDGDGKPDLATANFGDNKLSVLRNNPILPHTITSFNPISGNVGATITISGTGFNTTPANNVVFFGATKATVTAATASSLTVTVPLGAIHAVISVMNTATNFVAYSQKQFLPSFTPNKDSVTPADFVAKVDFATQTKPGYIALGDLDGDGKVDMAVTNETSNTVSLFLNTGTSGNPTYATSVDLTTGAQPEGVAIGDIDGDGKPDIAVTNFNANSVSIYRNISTVGRLDFAVKVDLALGSCPFFVVIRDINGDGRVDLVTANKDANTISVVLNIGSVNTISFAAAINLSTGTGSKPYAVTVGDLDGDGKPDLAAAGYGTNNISIFRNTGTNGLASFGAQQDFPVNTPYSISIGDLDGDGLLDLATANFMQNTISVFKNTSTSGTINFAVKADLSLASRTYSVAIGDINGDGKPDLVVPNYSNDNVSLFSNKSSAGSIIFASREEVATGVGPDYVAIGDLDGDGKSDLVVANYTANSVSVLRNKLIAISTSGTLAALSTTYNAGPSATSTNFTVSGSNLLAGIVITPPTGFELSQTAGGTSGYAGNGTAITVGAAGTVASTTIYVRLAAGNAGGVYSGNIVCTSNTANTMNLATVSSTVIGAPLTITANNANKTYGNTLAGAAGATTFTSTGLLNGDTMGSVSIAYTAGAGNGNTATDAVGNYTGKVIPSAATGGTFSVGNYTITYAPGNIIVDAAPLTITASNANRTYGTTLTGGPGATTFSSTGLLNGDTLGSVTIAYTASAGNGNTAADAVGTYIAKVIPSAATGGTFTASNYSITYVAGNIAVRAAPLTITASTRTKAYGDLVTFAGTEFTSIGLINGNTITGATLISTGAAANAAVAGSPYPIVASTAIGTGLSNYNITYVDGSLTVNNASQTITFNALPAMSYGDTNFSLSATGGASGNAVTYISSNPAVATISGNKITILGAGTTNITASQVGNANYNAAVNVLQTLTVGKKPLTITATNITRLQGLDNPTLTVTYNGFVNGENATNALITQPMLSTSATPASSQGDYPITVSGAVAANGNYAITYIPGKLTVTAGLPTSVSLAASTLFENRPAGILAGTLSATSDNPAATFTYSLVSGTGDVDNALFSISGSTISTTQSFDFETKASYSILVKASTDNGLSLTKQFTILITNVNEAPTLNAITNQAICYTPVAQTIALSGISAGPEAGQTVILSVVSSNPSLFSELSITGSTLKYIPAADASGTATLTVTVKDNGGTANGGIDTYSRSFTVMLNALPMISISSDLGTSLSKGETAILTASGGATYSWATAAGILSSQNTATLTVRPLVTTSYTVTVSNPGGCSEVKSILITVQDDYVAVQGVNILSPNGDGTNDALIIKNLDMYPNHTLKIFDRTGRILFQTNNYQNDWKGTFQGSALTEGTYFYIVEFAADKKVIKGFVSIVN